MRKFCLFTSFFPPKYLGRSDRTMRGLRRETSRNLNEPNCSSPQQSDGSSEPFPYFQSDHLGGATGQREVRPVILVPEPQCPCCGGAVVVCRLPFTCCGNCEQIVLRKVTGKSHTKILTTHHGSGQLMYPESLAVLTGNIHSCQCLNSCTSHRPLLWADGHSSGHRGWFQCGLRLQADPQQGAMGNDCLSLVGILQWLCHLPHYPTWILPFLQARSTLDFSSM